MSVFYPVYLDLRNRQSLVIGGNAEAEKKLVEPLADVRR